MLEEKKKQLVEYHKKWSSMNENSYVYNRFVDILKDIKELEDKCYELTPKVQCIKEGEQFKIQK